MNGINILRANVVGTAIFSISAIVAAVVFDGVAKTQGVVVALALFTVGIATFLWGYWTAVQRSREQEISVAELYFLMGQAIPKKVKVVMHSCLAAQCVVAVATALARPNTLQEGAESSSRGSTLAFGVLVPVLGLGLNGLWAATYGTFGARRLKGETSPSESHPDDRQIG
jgi:hypothetical protein